MVRKTEEYFDHFFSEGLRGELSRSNGIIDPSLTRSSLTDKSDTMGRVRTKTSKRAAKVMWADTDTMNTDNA